MVHKPTYEELEQRIKELENEAFERKQAEEALRKEKKIIHSYDLMDYLISHARSAIAVHDRDLNYLYVSKRYLEEYNVKEQNVIGKHHYEVFPDLPQKWRDVHQKSLAGEVLSAEEDPYFREDGSVDWTRWECRPWYESDGSIGGIIIYTEVINERKQAEKALRESQSNLQSVFDAVPVGICFMKDRVYKRANKNWCDSFGYPEESLLGRTPEFLYENTEEYRRVGKELYGQLLEYGIASARSKLKRSDGEFRDVVLTAKPLDSEDIEAGTVVVIHDITHQKRAKEEKKRLEEQLQQVHKMEAIGTLAGGIAHDFNNLLMGIQGRTSIMLMDKDSSHPDFEHLRGIESYVGSAADLTKQLLGFARGGKYEVKPTDLNELIKKENRMFGRTKKEITIREKYEKDLWPVEIDRGQIQQVLLNLYVNAWQAMPGGGNLYVETENVTLDENDVKPFFVKPGRYAKISITDTGTGMDKAIQEKIFDPFFTTKEMGRGTGLGLASVYGIIKNHGGFINVYSEKGYGSTFRIYLPASEKEFIEEKKPPGETLRGTETVLFVDDENLITETAEVLLKLLGYKILIAASGKEAIKVYKENKERIDIVILDMIMPDISGSETYDRIKEIDPKVKVLLSSGYSVNGQATEILARGCNGFIQKPFKMKELSQKVRKILDEE